MSPENSLKQPNKSRYSVKFPPEIWIKISGYLDNSDPQFALSKALSYSRDELNSSKAVLEAVEKEVVFRLHEGHILSNQIKHRQSETDFLINALFRRVRKANNIARIIFRPDHGGAVTTTDANIREWNYHSESLNRLMRSIRLNIATLYEYYDKAFAENNGRLANGRESPKNYLEKLLSILTVTKEMSPNSFKQKLSSINKLLDKVKAVFAGNPFLKQVFKRNVKIKVSNAWRPSDSEEPGLLMLVNHLDIESYGALSPQALQLILQPFKRSVKKITINSDLNVKMLEVILEDCQRLQSLVINGTLSGNFLKVKVRKHKSLTHLSMHVTRLETLNKLACGSALCEVLPNFSSLKLTIAGQQAACPEQVAKCIPSFQIHALTLQFANIIRAPNDFFFTIMNDFYPSLEKLKLLSGGAVYPGAGYQYMKMVSEQSRIPELFSSELFRQLKCLDLSETLAFNGAELTPEKQGLYFTVFRKINIEDTLFSRAKKPTLFISNQWHDGEILINTALLVNNKHVQIDIENLLEFQFLLKVKSRSVFYFFNNINAETIIQLISHPDLHSDVLSFLCAIFQDWHSDISLLDNLVVFVRHCSDRVVVAWLEWLWRWTSERDQAKEHLDYFFDVFNIMISADRLALLDQCGEKIQISFRAAYILSNKKNFDGRDLDAWTFLCYKMRYSSYEAHDYVHHHLGLYIHSCKMSDLGRVFSCQQGKRLLNALAFCGRFPALPKIRPWVTPEIVVNILKGIGNNPHSDNRWMPFTNVMMILKGATPLFIDKVNSVVAGQPQAVSEAFYQAWFIARADKHFLFNKSTDVIVRAFESYCENSSDHVNELLNNIDNKVLKILMNDEATGFLASLLLASPQWEPAQDIIKLCSADIVIALLLKSRVEFSRVVQRFIDFHCFSEDGILAITESVLNDFCKFSKVNLALLINKFICKSVVYDGDDSWLRAFTLQVLLCDMLTNSQKAIFLVGIRRTLNGIAERNKKISAREKRDRVKDDCSELDKYLTRKIDTLYFRWRLEGKVDIAKRCVKQFLMRALDAHVLADLLGCKQLLGSGCRTFSNDERLKRNRSVTIFELGSANFHSDFDSDSDAEEEVLNPAGFPAFGGMRPA